MKWWKNCTFPSPVRIIDYGPFRTGDKVASNENCSRHFSAMCFQRKWSHIGTGMMNPKRLTLTIHNYVHKNSRNTPSHLYARIPPFIAIHSHPANDCTKHPALHNIGSLNLWCHQRLGNQSKQRSRKIIAKKTTWGRGWMTKAGGVGEIREEVSCGGTVIIVSRHCSSQRGYNNNILIYNI